MTDRLTKQDPFDAFADEIMACRPWVKVDLALVARQHFGPLLQAVEEIRLGRYTSDGSDRASCDRFISIAMRAMHEVEDTFNG